MPKRPHRDKQAARPGAPLAARDLISARLPSLIQRALSAPEESEWHVAVMKALGPELAVKVNRCSLERGTLTVVAESSAWAARMRFALAETAEIAAVTPGFKELVVRVRPRRGPVSKA
jgi:Dna[CI] antecedent DciA-like protein